MAFTKEQTESFRTFARNAKRPLIFFDDDGDGTTSFTMLYHAIGTGKGVPVKNGPEVTDFYLRKVNEYQPDIIFVLDKPMVSDDFIDAVSVPIVWLDHHAPQQHNQDHVHYFNPRDEDDEDNRPTSYWTYHFIGKPEDVWIGMTGVVADWHMPDFIDECQKRYPALVPEHWERFEDFYTHEPLAMLVKLMTFMQKGTITESMRAVRTFTRILDPVEILEQTTPAGRYLWKRYARYAEEYDQLCDEALKQEGEMIVFEYEGATSFTQELSNELLLKSTADIIIVARKHEGAFKASFRSKKTNIVDPLKKALEGLRGNVGGHKNACGGKIFQHDWKEFIERFKKNLAV